MATSKNDTPIRWETPTSPRGFDWAPVVAALKERPGEWALIAEDRNIGFSRTGIRHGLEITVRGVNQSTRVAARIYARWPEERS